MGLFINLDDLTPFVTVDQTKADLMIADAEAEAIAAAACLVDPADPISVNPALTVHQVALVKGILRAAVLRWVEHGIAGTVQQETAGPFSKTTDTRRRSMFWPDEIEQLQRLCGGSSGAFSIDTAPDCSIHLPWCSISSIIGATYCSCGADIAGEPIYELGG